MKNNIFMQKCNSCGYEFEIKYTINGYEYLGQECNCEDTFSPINNSPSIEQWKQSK